MSKYPNASEETAAMQRREAMETRPQDRYSGRLKFTGCRQCMSEDGMRSIHRDELRRFVTPLSMAIADIVATLCGESGNDEYLFYTCHHCNEDRAIPNGYETMSLSDVLTWLADDADPMAPDYAALAAEEPVLASQADRDAAGLEG